MDDRSLLLHYESITGPRVIEIAPVKQMGRVRWHVRANDTRLAMAGSFFDTRERAQAIVEETLRKKYGEALALEWRST